MNRVLAGLLVFLALVAFAARADVRLEPFVSGVASPVYLTHGGDGSNRLYIVEQAGRILVLVPGETTPDVFLDIRNRVRPGGEQGLLGLAFHPGYAANGRFFVYYTRETDGAIVISEFARSTDPLLASTQERVTLVIPHPGQANHNGGALAFGPDGFLYAGVGDGGSGNDPPNNAQNLATLLGKIVRIDVDREDDAAGTAYGIPADNPFVDAPGRDEIYAYGFRNPWRFSFDRVTGSLWVADVGQGAREEVDAPVQRGGNYGWRVYEGTLCTQNDPLRCDPANYIAPLFEYGHAQGRCSITGGFVYRGARATLVPGSYVYGDYCTGEIFVWDGAIQKPLLTLAGSLASFGEDELGELYVVDRDGAILRIAGQSLPVAVEFHHAGFDHYFTTSLSTEIEALEGGTIEGWTRTGQSFRVDAIGAAGRAAVCRFFSASFAPKSSHFYTPFAIECDTVKANPAWTFEGEVFSILLPAASGTCASGLVPLYRLYNDGKGGAPNHRYTNNVDIRRTMLQQGWIAEGFGADGVFGCVPL